MRFFKSAGGSEQIRTDYQRAFGSGLLQERRNEALERLSSCTLCPRRCAVDRLAGNLGFCKTARSARVSSAQLHFGEEKPLVGSGGSGTIFFAYCSLGCTYCQNYEISHLGHGREVSDEDLARMMLFLQDRGAENINLVTPSHVVPQILSALCLATEHGLSLPLVYNTSAYDEVSTLRLLDGIVDIYMPDFKFWEAEVSGRLADAADYPEVARQALCQMHRQVGDLVLDNDGKALRGLLVRHLVLPEDLAGTRQVMEFLAKEISPNTYVNVMAQYRPCGELENMPGLQRRLSEAEYSHALQETRRAGERRIHDGDPLVVIT